MNEIEIQEGARQPREEATFRKLDEQPNFEQRRAHPRFSVDLDVNFGSDHNFYAGFAENLSAGGIFVATHMLKPVGEILEINIHLPDGAAIRGKGEVRWIREYNESSNVPPGMGIRFVELAAGSTEAIESFLCRRDPMFFDDE